MEVDPPKGVKRKNINSSISTRAQTAKLSKSAIDQASKSTSASSKDNKLSSSSKPSVSSSSNPSGSSNLANPDPVTLKQKPKPIEAKISLQVLQNYIKSSSKSIQINNISIRQFIKDNIKHVRIHCSTVDEKEKVSQLLKDHAVSYHSFTENEFKNIVYVLKGYDVNSDTEEILEDLKAHQVPAIKVTTIVKSSEYRSAVHLVHFTKDSINVNVLNHRHKSIYGGRVSWEVQLHKNKKPTQCHTCQRWGHSSLNCGYPARCVKCDGSHSTINCSRNRSDANPPKCVNCGGEHTANFAKCPNAEKYRQSIKPRPHPRQQGASVQLPSDYQAWSIPCNDETYEQEFPNSLRQQPIAPQYTVVQPRMFAAQSEKTSLHHHPLKTNPHSIPSQHISSGQEFLNNDPVKENLVSLAPILSLPPNKLELLLKLLIKIADLVSSCSQLDVLIDQFTSIASKLSVTRESSVIEASSFHANSHNES